ncbi:MAG: ferritin-like domain-containing protein [Halothiobacillaceae bacterium]
MRPYRYNTLPPRAPGASGHMRSPMAAQQMNPRVLGFLGRALSLEFSAGQYYLAQAALARSRNEEEYAEGFGRLAGEEFMHAERLIQRMVEHGALPSGSVLRPSEPAMDVVDALVGCQQRELELINLYSEALGYMARMGAGEDHALFRGLLEEEQDQLQRVEQWLADYQAMMTRGPASMGRPFA